MDQKLTLLSEGCSVYKLSGKPFQSGLKLATVTGKGVHPITGRPVYYFEEDDSFVECRRCAEVNTSESGLESPKE